MGKKMTDQDIMARTIYGEARGEGLEGMQGVANVILNRFALWDKHPHFGIGTVESVCLDPWQFSCWNANDPNVEVIKSVTTDDPVFAHCMDIASDALTGALADNTNSATYYYVKGSREPSWAFGKDPCAIIGAHLFFRDIA
jgi:N-acetylmuramoyl-L-alanine amidase